MAGGSGKQGKTGLIVTIIVLAVTLLIVGGIVWWQNTRPAADQSTDTPTTSEEAANEEESETPPVDESPVTELDPSKTSTITIESMGIIVAYTKGIPGFEFQVKRSGQGAQYVEFLSPQLIGTKCTDDEGRFASIIRNPRTEDEQTVSQSTTIGEDTYGLTLADDICTNDPELLKEYQAAFSDGLSFLKVVAE